MAALRRALALVSIALLALAYAPAGWAQSVSNVQTGASDAYYALPTLTGAQSYSYWWCKRDAGAGVAHVRQASTDVVALSGQNSCALIRWTGTAFQVLVNTTPSSAPVVTSVNGSSGAVTVSAASLGLAPVATSGSAADLSLGTLPTARLPALTGGDVTSSAGSGGLTLVAAQPGAHSWALTQTFTLAPAFGDPSGTRTALGLPIGTSGATVPLLNGVNTWSGTQTLSSTSSFFGSNAGAGVSVVLNGAAANGKYVYFRTGNISRWALGSDTTAEGGSNAGSNYTLAAYSDAGSFLGYAWTIDRASRVMTFPVSPVVPTPSPLNNSTQASSTAYVDAAVTAATPNVITAGTAVGDASHVPQLTYDARGRLTTVTPVLVTPAAIGAQAAGTYATGTGSATGTNTGDQTSTGSGDVTWPTCSSACVTTLLTAQTAAHSWAGIQTLSSAAPELRLAETDQTDPVGQFRWLLNGDVLDLQRAASAAWATNNSVMAVTGSSRVVNFGVTPQVSGTSVVLTTNATLTGAAQKASNLSDLANALTARTNLKAQQAGVFTGTGSDATSSYNITNGVVYRFSAALTAARILNLSATGAYDGVTLRVIFTGTGGFTLTVRDTTVTTNAKALAINQWVDFTWDSVAGAWFESAFGSL